MIVRALAINRALGSADPGWTDPPAHVPTELVVDFDYFDPPKLQELGLQMALLAVRDASPRLFWTGRNGGHWVATRAADLEEIRTNHGHFSNTGISIPRSKMPSLPLECDPPLHTELRRIISPLFTPDTIRTADILARKISAELADQLAPRGHCEFQADFARHLPIAIFLHLVDLPMADAPRLLHLAELRVRTADVPKRDAAKQEIIEYLAAVVAERRAHPGKDFISRIANAKVGERPLSDHEMWNVLATIMFGGLDTVVSGLGYMMRFLALNEERRHWLARQPSIPYNAVDELFRVHGVVSNARLIMHDIVFQGVAMRAGEQILVPTALHGLDEQLFEDPLTVKFDRPNVGKMGAFGHGVHRCVAANLGRLEVKVVLEEWLKRVPDFALLDDDRPVFTAGIAATVLHLPLQWRH